MENFDWRYEIKFLVEPEEWFQIQQMLALHPASFKTIFPDRIVNNIYYDTPNFATCQDNMSGIAVRRKYRHRWYGQPENKFVDSVFEIKIKDNALGRKETFKISELDTNGQIPRQKLPESLCPLHLIPVLQNQYLRSYYLNAEGNFRLTIDRNIKYQKGIDHALTDRSYGIEDHRIVLELKFGQDDIPNQKEITQYIPFRTSKHSKYVTGILACY